MKTARKDENMKIIKTIIFTILLIILVGCNKSNNEKKINIISTSFPGYDFARAITKNVEDVNVQMLLNQEQKCMTMSQLQKI